MKKFYALFLVLAMAASVFSGCAEGDKALYNALKATAAAENLIETTVLTYDVKPVQPFSVEKNPESVDFWSGWYFEQKKSEAENLNRMVDTARLFAEDFALKTVAKKSGGNVRTDVTFVKPDFEADFTMWQQDENKVIINIPTYVSPFMYPTMGNKQYIVFDADAMNGIIEDETGEVVNEIDMDIALKLINDFAEKFVDKLSYPLVINTVEENGENVYTVKLNREILKGLTDNSLEILSDDETAALASMGIYILAGDNAGSVEDIREGYAEFINDLKDGAEELFADMEETAELTARFSVNSEGLISRREIEFSAEIKADSLYGYFENAYTATGSFRITVNAVTDYDYTKPEITVPVLTDENSIDLCEDFTEYQEYQEAYSDWYYDWFNYHPSDTYANERDPYTPITVKNLENGKEITITPGMVTTTAEELHQYGIAMPLAELSSIFDNVSLTWNEITMGVELRCSYEMWGETSERCVYIPNADGIALLDEYYINGDYDESYNYVYNGDTLSPETIALLESYDIYFYDSLGDLDGTDIVFSAYFDENGKCFMDFDEFFDFIGYVCRLDGNVLSVRKESSSFSYEGIEDNLFYNMRYYF